MQNMIGKLPPGFDMDMLMKLVAQYGGGQPPMQNKGPAPFSPGKGIGDVAGAAAGMAGSVQDAQNLANAGRWYGQGPLPSFKELGQGSVPNREGWADMGQPGLGAPWASMKIPKANGPQRVSPGMYKGADGKVFKSKTQPR